ncbi:MAG TPA: erythromycin esterase family protein [Burkholderiaceae bacterium]|nr:erythromycin esterase family protein [Burkholderiaceae bacterium]
MRTITPSAAHSPASIAIASSAHLLKGAANDYDPLLELIGDARFVLLGEASHGTHEFYRERANITRRLITEKNFTAVAVEADWPDAYRVNRYVRGGADDANAKQALSGFKRFPTWMWRNTDVVAFIEWLRRHNDGLPPESNRAGFYGLDLYSLFTSMEEVLRYLDDKDPEAARHARTRYACFDHFGEDSQRYGYATGIRMSASCEEAVIAQLRDLQMHASDLLKRDGRCAADEFFHAEQNAQLVKDAEQYYRTMFQGNVSSWNIRDRHMADTLDALARHLSKMTGAAAKIVVWAHNSHLGDASATELGQHGQWNLGQLARRQYGNEAVLIGFTTHHGTVTAASDWDGPAERKRVRVALPESYERVFHDTGLPEFLLLTRGNSVMQQPALAQRLERAIGVIYLPHSERHSHYFHASLAQQFDAVLHFDETHAVEPLERTASWHSGEAPETWPVGV